LSVKDLDWPFPFAGKLLRGHRSFALRCEKGSAPLPVALLCRKRRRMAAYCTTGMFVIGTALCQECARRSARKGMTEFTKFPKSEAWAAAGSDEIDGKIDDTGLCRRAEYRR